MCLPDFRPPALSGRRRFFVAYKETPESQVWITDLRLIQVRYLK